MACSCPGKRPSLITRSAHLLPLSAREFCGHGLFRPTGEVEEMDRANERLLAAATSGDVEQLQVTWSDPAHTAPCGRCSIKRPGCVWCSCGWERGPSSRTKTGTALHSRGSTIGGCGWRSAAAPQRWRTADAQG
jgi:hypothetical protein